MSHNINPSGGQTCENLEAECNILGMELLNVLEYIGDTVDYRQITPLIQKLSNSMDFITANVNKLKNIALTTGELEEQLQEKKEILSELQEKLKRYKLIIGNE